VEEWLAANKPLNMIVRSHQVVDDGVQKWFDGHLYTVFSASNYCGVVDNKGAYMTFKPTTFPLPKITKYYSPSKLLLKRVTAPNVPVVIQDVVCRLADLITQSNKELEDYWKDDADGKPTISKQQWEEGLTKILELEIPWHGLFEMIPGAKDAVVDEKTNELDYGVFLENYRPFNLIRKMKASSNQGGRGRSGSPVGTVKEKAMQVLQAISNAIFQYRYDLEAAFRWLDADNSGGISVDELRTCLESLAEAQMIDAKELDLSDEVITALINEIDLNSDGQVDYDEFMEAFQGSVYTNVQSHFASLPVSGSSAEPVNLRERSQVIKEVLIDCSFDMQYSVDDLFKWMDHDGSGYVSMEKFRNVLFKLRDSGKIDERQVMLTDAVIQTLVDDIDLNSDGLVELEDFHECFGDNMYSLKKSILIQPEIPLQFEELLKRAGEAKAALGSAIYHYQYDAKQAYEWIACDTLDGISKENLSMVLDFLVKHGLVDNDNLDISSQVVQRMLDDLDLNSDGQIDYEEFKEAFEQYFRTT
jgi:serine/threonine-protein phosphatase with EF-hand domain